MKLKKQPKSNLERVKHIEKQMKDAITLIQNQQKLIEDLIITISFLLYREDISNDEIEEYKARFIDPDKKSTEG